MKLENLGLAVVATKAHEDGPLDQKPGTNPDTGDFYKVIEA